MRRAYVSIGGNVGKVQDALQAAVDALRTLEGTVFVAASPWYDTSPVEAQGPDFMNGVVALDTDLSPYALLLRLQDIEQRLGRDREHEHQRNSPRRIDIDLLMLGDLTMDSAPLTIPHPRMHRRAFALQPLLDIAPDVVVPGHGRAAELLEELSAQRIARRSVVGPDTRPR